METRIKSNRAPREAIVVDRFAILFNRLSEEHIWPIAPAVECRDSYQSLSIAAEWVECGVQPKITNIHKKEMHHA